MSVRFGGRNFAGLVVFAVEHWSWLCLKKLCYLVSGIAGFSF